jgi:hypothetical protein
MVGVAGVLGYGRLVASNEEGRERDRLHRLLLEVAEEQKKHVH